MKGSFLTSITVSCTNNGSEPETFGASPSTCSLCGQEGFPIRKLIYRTALLVAVAAYDPGL